MWEKCTTNQVIEDFHVYDGFLMRGNQLYILKSLLEEKLIHNLYGGDIVGHLGHDKTFATIKQIFY